MGSKSMKPPPDPVAVLSGHRASVSGACFHPSRPFLFTGAHSAVHGIIVVGDQQNYKGRDGTVKCWDIEERGLPRTPSLTIRTNSYHFCKLSLVKKPIANTKQGNDETVNIELTNDSRGKREKDQKEGSNTFEDPLHIGLTEETSVEGLKYVAIAGEQSSEIKLWDLNTGEKTVGYRKTTLPVLPVILSSKEACTWQFNLFCHPATSEGFLNVLAGSMIVDDPFQPLSCCSSPI